MPNNNSTDKNNLLLALQANVKTLQQGIDAHCCLVDSLLQGASDERIMRSPARVCPKRERELRLERVIQDAISDLEESRKAFKSKRLEALRRKLTRTLLEQD